ncbi:unnamed protein product [Lathyrus oleraceus]
MKFDQCSSCLKQKNYESCESSVYTSSRRVPKCHCGDKVVIRRAQLIRILERIFGVIQILRDPYKEGVVSSIGSMRI